MTKVIYECGCTAGCDLISPYCPIHTSSPIVEEIDDAPAVVGMSEEDAAIITFAVIRIAKENGEIAECLVKGDPTSHWKQELGVLCAAIDPLLILADTNFDTACAAGMQRKMEKTIHLTNEKQLSGSKMVATEFYKGVR